MILWVFVKMVAWWIVEGGLSFSLGFCKGFAAYMHWRDHLTSLYPVYKRFLYDIFGFCVVDFRVLFVYYGDFVGEFWGILKVFLWFSSVILEILIGEKTAFIGW